MKSRLEIFDLLQVCGSPDRADHIVAVLAAGDLVPGLSMDDWAWFLELAEKMTGQSKKALTLMAGVDVPKMAEAMQELIQNGIIAGRLSLAQFEVGEA